MESLRKITNTIRHPVFVYRFHESRINEVERITVHKEKKEVISIELREPRGPMSGPAKPTYPIDARQRAPLDIRKVRLQNCAAEQVIKQQRRIVKPRAGVKTRIMEELKIMKAMLKTMEGETSLQIQERIAFLKKAANNKGDARQRWKDMVQKEGPI